MNKFKKTNNGRIVTPEFRLSFHSLYEKTQYGDGKPCWSCNMIFEKKDTDFSDLYREMNRIAKEKWGEKPNNLRNPIREGSEYEHDGYGEDKIFFTARNSDVKPIVRDENSKILPEDDRKIYNGCYCIASISVFAYPGKKNEGKVNKGLAFQIHQIKKISDGEPFGAVIDNSGDELGNYNGSDDDNFDDDMPF